MGFSDFWLQLNNGKKMSLQNLKELKKSDLEGNNALLRIFNIFDTQNADGTKGSDGVLNKEELTSLFNTMQKAAQSSKGKDTSIFETEEAEDFINTTQTTEGKTLKELGIKATDMFEFLSKLVKTSNSSLTVNNMPTNVNLTEEQAQEEVISILSNDAAEARTLLMKQDNGVVSDLYNKYKEWRDDDLSLSNIEEAVVLQQEGADNLYKAKEGKLSKREYFLQNREHLKTMMKRRLFRKDENTGLDFLDRNRGKMTKEKFAKFMEKYINEQIDKIDKLDSLKNIQHTLFITTDAGVEQMLKNYKKRAEEDLLHNPVTEQRLIKIKTPKIPQEFDTTEPMTFEEVFKFERNQEYSKDKVENYLRQKQKTDFATGAYNKYQSFKMASDEFLDNYKSSTKVYSDMDGNSWGGNEPNPNEQMNKVIELFTAYYDNPFKPDKAKEELEHLISENNLPISVITKEDGSISLDLSKISNDNQKNRVLNQLVKLEAGKLKTDLETTFGGDIEERLTLISSQTQGAYTNAYGQDFTQELAQEMADDNKTFIQKYTGNTSMVGMGLTVVGGILCFTPAAPLGAGMVTVGNTLAIGGMVAESSLGYTEALTRSSLDEEEIKELSKTLVMNAGGFVIGMKAGKTGMKAFNKLIDKKLAEVFKTEMVKGNRVEALKQVFTNPEHLKNFMQAAGVKLSADFIISYAGDLAMMGVLDTHDDWQSLLQANLIGIMAGMGGDIKEAAHLGMKGDKYRKLRQKEAEHQSLRGSDPDKYLEYNDKLAPLRKDPDIQRVYGVHGENEVVWLPKAEDTKAKIKHRTKEETISYIKRDMKLVIAKEKMYSHAPKQFQGIHGFTHNIIDLEQELKNVDKIITDENASVVYEYYKQFKKIGYFEAELIKDIAYKYNTSELENTLNGLLYLQQVPKLKGHLSPDTLHSLASKVDSEKTPILVEKLQKCYALDWEDICTFIEISKECSEELSQAVDTGFFEHFGNSSDNFDIIIATRDVEMTKARLDFYNKHTELFSNKYADNDAMDLRLINQYNKNIAERVLNDKNLADKWSQIVKNIDTEAKSKFANRLLDYEEKIIKQIEQDPGDETIYTTLIDDINSILKNYVEGSDDAVFRIIENGEFNEALIDYDTDCWENILKRDLLNVSTTNDNFVISMSTIQTWARAKNEDVIKQHMQLLQSAFENKDLLKSGLDDITDADICSVVGSDEAIIALDKIGKGTIEAAFPLMLDEFGEFLHEVATLEISKDNNEILLQKINPQQSQKYQQINDEITGLKKKLNEVVGADNLARIKELQAQKAQIDEQIKQLKQGASAETPEVKQQVKELQKQSKALGSQAQSIYYQGENAAQVKEIMKDISNKQKELKEFLLQNSGLEPQEVVTKLRVLSALSEISTEEEMTVFINMIKPSTPENDAVWNEAVNKKIYQKLGVEYDEALSQKLDLINCKYISKLFISSEEFFDNMKTLVEIVRDNPNLTIEQAIDQMPQNVETKRIFEKLGFDYEKFTKVDKNSYTTVEIELNAEEAKQAAIHNLEEDLNDTLFQSLPKEVTEPIFKHLKEQLGVTLKKSQKDNWEGDGFSAGSTEYYRLYKDGKPITFEEMDDIVSLIKKDIVSNDFWTKTHSNPQIDNARGTMYTHLIKMRTQEVDNASSIKEGETAEIEVRKTDMYDIKKALGLGNDAQCCTALGRNFNEWSAPTYIMNKCIGAIELTDKGSFVGNTMIYLAYVDGKPALVLDNIELKTKYQNNDKIRDTFVDYAKKLCAEIGQPDLPIFAGPNRHKLNMDIYDKSTHTMEIIGSSGEQEVYVDYDAGKHTVGKGEKAKIEMYRLR